MKVGMIFESGPDGADVKVCTLLAKRLKPGIQIESFTAAKNKPDMIQKCGKATKALLDTGCDRVVIIWDLYPPWREKKPCRKEDREAIFESLVEADVPKDAKVYLVCIEEELETWLIADKRALEVTLPRLNRKEIKNLNKPAQEPDPKTWLDRLYRRAGHQRGYVDYWHAEKIAQQIPDWKRVKRCPSFVRFALKVADVKPQALK